MVYECLNVTRETVDDTLITLVYVETLDLCTMVVYTGARMQLCVTKLLEQIKK